MNSEFINSSGTEKIRIIVYLLMYSFINFTFYDYLKKINVNSIFMKFSKKFYF